MLSLAPKTGLLVLAPGPGVATRPPRPSGQHSSLLVRSLPRTGRARPRSTAARLALALANAESLTRELRGRVSPPMRAAIRRDLGNSARRLRSLARSSLRESRGQSAEEVQARRATGGGVPEAAAAALEWPVRGPITSGFGRRWGGVHKGIDIGVPEGMPVRAAAPGTVTLAGWLDGDGNVVVMDHGAGVSTAYLHLSTILVPAGKVAAGAAIGTSGCTGYCFGPHLHFELRIAGRAIDPLPVLSAATALAGQPFWRSSEMASTG